MTRLSPHGRPGACPNMIHPSFSSKTTSQNHQIAPPHQPAASHSKPLPLFKTQNTAPPPKSHPVPTQCAPARLPEGVRLASALAALQLLPVPRFFVGAPGADPHLGRGTGPSGRTAYHSVGGGRGEATSGLSIYLSICLSVCLSI